MLSIRKTSILIAVFATASIFVAYTQVFGISPDYRSYESFFGNLRFDLFRAATFTRFEPGFSVASGIAISIFSTNTTAYSSLVFIAVLTKLIFIRKFANKYFFLLAIILYFTKYFSLHELTQLRAGMASSLLIVSCYYCWSKQRIRGSISSALAISLHYSSFLVSALLFLPQLNRRKSIALFFIMLITFTLTNSILFGFAGSYLSILASYAISTIDTPALKAFSPVLFPEFFLIAVSLFYWRDLTETMQRVVTMQLVGFAFWFGFLDIQVIAVRIRELFSVIWVLYIAQGYLCRIEIKVAIHFFILMAAALGFYMYHFSNFFN